MVDSTSMVPLSRLTIVWRTTSMPTPRPEISETWAAVENPAAKIRPRAAASVIAVASSAVTRPRSTARALSLAGSSPRPSSETRISTWLPR
jgi:hypothetical protein